MENYKKIFNIFIQIITAPFNLLIKSNAITNPNKKVKTWLVLLISIVIVSVIIFLYYFAEELFQW